MVFPPKGTEGVSVRSLNNLSTVEKTSLLDIGPSSQRTTSALVSIRPEADRFDTLHELAEWQSSGTLNLECGVLAPRSSIVAIPDPATAKAIFPSEHHLAKRALKQKFFCVHQQHRGRKSPLSYCLQNHQEL